ALLGGLRLRGGNTDGDVEGARGRLVDRAHERSSSRQSESLAARVGRWSARHWKTAVFGWLAFVLIAFGAGKMVGIESLSTTDPGPGESGRGQQILHDAC